MYSFVGLNYKPVWRPGLEEGFHVGNAYYVSANTSDTSSSIEPTATRQGGRCDFLDIIVNMV